MITADQLVCHAVGDYLLQSDWMAAEKLKKHRAALAHVLTYGAPFLFLTRSITALSFIVVTHFVIDRWRLARYVCWLKNFFAPPSTVVETKTWATDAGEYVRVRSSTTWWHPWAECVGTGYHNSRPPWLATWLLIIADNTLHILCNGIAIAWLVR